jgi:hypothetical protein
MGDAISYCLPFFNLWFQDYDLGDLLFIEAHIEACEDQHEENAVKLVSLVKRQIGFD